MKRMIMLCAACSLAVAVMAQAPAVQVTVQYAIKKKITKEGHTTVSGYTMKIYPDEKAQSATLKINVANLTRQPVEGLTLRWAIVKTRISSQSLRGSAATAYGAEEPLNLKPQETKVIDTPAVESSYWEHTTGTKQGGDKILGYGVQVSSSGKVFFQQIVPATAGSAFMGQLRAVGSEETPQKPDTKKKKK